MSASVVALCIWVVAGSIIAVLPMRHQMIPGALLLLSGLALIVWIGAENGWTWSVVALAIFASLFRRPLVALIRHASGKPVEPPRD